MSKRFIYNFNPDLTILMLTSINDKKIVIFFYKTCITSIDDAYVAIDLLETYQSTHVFLSEYYLTKKALIRYPRAAFSLFLLTKR